MSVNEHERLSNFTLSTRVKEKEQLVVRKDMGVNEHERLSNITPSQYTSKRKGTACSKKGYGCK